ncbi:MAG: hypothetical protein ABUL50_09275, partial [Rhizobacter sp.]
MNRLLSLTALGLALVGAGFSTLSAEAASRRVVHGNADGGVTASAVTARQGASGAAVRGRAVRTDGQGNATAVSGAAVKGVNGGSAARAGKTTVAADGSATHQSGVAAQSAKGSVESSGSASRDASGNVTQARSSTVTSAATGNTMNTSSAYSKDTGVT